MSGPSQISPNLPHTDQVPAPRSTLLKRFRRLGSAAAHLWWDLEISGLEHLPRTGPVILAPNHIAVIDGPLVVVATPRTTVALAKSELFVGGLGTFLDRAGQISLARDHVDTMAMRRGVRVLRDGGALAIFPEGVRARGDFARIHGGAAYLATVTGAPIVPVGILGTRTSAQSVRDLPRPRTRVHLNYGAPIQLSQESWPRPQALIAERTEFLRRQLAGHIVQVQAETGLSLPGAPAELVPAA